MPLHRACMVEEHAISVLIGPVFVAERSSVAPLPLVIRSVFSETSPELLGLRRAITSLFDQFFDLLLLFHTLDGDEVTTPRLASSFST